MGDRRVVIAIITWLSLYTVVNAAVLPSPQKHIRGIIYGRGESGPGSLLKQGGALYVASQNGSVSFTLGDYDPPPLADFLRWRQVQGGPEIMPTHTVIDVIPGMEEDLVDLTPVWEASGLADDVLPLVMGKVLDKDNVYRAVPTMGGAQVCLFSIPLAEKLPPFLSPANIKTWSQLKEICAAFADLDIPCLGHGIYPYAHSLTLTHPHSLTHQSHSLINHSHSLTHSHNPSLPTPPPSAFLPILTYPAHKNTLTPPQTLWSYDVL